MKKRIVSILGAAVVCTAVASASDGFSIKGEIPGLKAGTKVELLSKERDGHGSLAEAVATDGAFVLTGSVKSPSICELRIDVSNEDGNMLDRSFRLMVENIPMTVSAAHLDSVPPGFYFGTGGLMMEKNVSITGGQAQKEFAEFNEAMFPYVFAAKTAHYNLYVDEKRDKSEEGEKRLEAAYEAANVDEAKARRRFMEEHPSYSVSGYYWNDILSEPFSFTSAELDALHEKLKTQTDTARLNRLERTIDYARKYQRGTQYTDFAVLDTIGGERRASEFAGPGKYMMVDFWASWCGPCRASIPHVRELYNTYGDRLAILSVSVDSAEKPWRKAMDQERMEWTQLWANKDKMETIRDAYQLTSIPYMLIINPDGQIIYAGHDPAEVSALLAAEME